MSMTKMVIVYSPNLRQRRHVVIPDATDDPATWDSVKVPMHAANLLPGEASVVGLLSDYRTIGPDAMLARLFSAPPSNHRCVVVDPFGIVTAVVNLDPAIDQHPHGLIYHDPHGQAVVGQSILGLGL